MQCLYPHMRKLSDSIRHAYDFTAYGSHSGWSLLGRRNNNLKSCFKVINEEQRRCLHIFYTKNVVARIKNSYSEQKFFSHLPVNRISVFQLRQCRLKGLLLLFLSIRQQSSNNWSHPGILWNMLSPLFPTPHPHLHASKMGKQNKKHIWKTALMSYLVISKDARTGR